MSGLDSPLSCTHDDVDPAGGPEQVDVAPGIPHEDYGDEPEHSGAIKLGETIDGTRLRVIERLSDGGSGVVFRGEHVELGKPVAIKILRRVVRTDDDRERFLAEARLATSIDSPHVVDVLDFGQLSDGRLWYAMELLDGRALSEEIDHNGRLSLSRAFSLLRMACKGLAATHARGMVHCDVKPHNLVIVQRGGREQMVLVDFGIAQTIGTRPHTVCGTPEYISPEQLDRAELDARTDVYALGCCAYEMFTGRLLVEESTLERAVSRHLLGIENELTFPVEANLPECVQALVRSCLARDPAGRPASMAALEAAICEAQIRCGVPPTREDLELPAVDRVRRDGIAIGFAGMVAPHSRRQQHAFFGGVLSAAAAIAIGILAARAEAEPAPAIASASLAALPSRLTGALASPTQTQVEAEAVEAEAIEVAEAPVLDPITPSAAEPQTRGSGAIDAGPRKHARRSEPAPDYWKARQIAAKQVRLHPESASARVQLGDALRGLGWSNAAARHYREGARLGSSKAKRRLASIEAG